MNINQHRQFIQLLFKVAAVVAVASLVILFFFRTQLFLKAFGKLLYILEPFLYGIAIAYLLNPVCEFFEKTFQKLAGQMHRPVGGAVRTVSMLLSLIVLFVMLFLLVIAVIPSLVESITSLVRELPPAIDRFEEWLRSLDQGEATHEAIAYLQQITDTLSAKLQDFLQTSFLPNLQTYLTNITSSFMSLFNVIKNFGLGCIVASYLMGNRERFLAQGKMVVYAVFPEKAARWIEGEVHCTDRMFSGFIHGKLLDSLIIGLLCYIFLLIMRMPYAVLVSVIVGVTNVIPFFGPYLGAIPSALLILTVSPMKCLIFLVFIIILQQFDGNILGPTILGDRLGISGIWILFSILFFSSIWGFAGMLLGVPVFAVLYDIAGRAVRRLLEAKDERWMIEGYEKRFPKEPPKKKPMKKPMIKKKS